MGEAYYLVQFVNGTATRYISAHALGGGYKLGEFWNDVRINSMIIWLTSVYGNGWSLVGEYSYEIPDSLENVGYTQQVRTTAVKQEWTNWPMIRNHDMIVSMCLTATDMNGNATRDESDIPTGFNERYISLFMVEELKTVKNVANYMGFLWNKDWQGKSNEELVALGNAELKR